MIKSFSRINITLTGLFLILLFYITYQDDLRNKINIWFEALQNNKKEEFNLSHIRYATETDRIKKIKEKYIFRSVGKVSLLYSENEEKMINSFKQKFSYKPSQGKLITTTISYNWKNGRWTISGKFVSVSKNKKRI